VVALTVVMAELSDDSPPFRPAALDELEARGFERVNRRETGDAPNGPLDPLTDSRVHILAARAGGHAVGAPATRRYWIGVWASNLAAFEYHGPWWISGERAFEDEGGVPEKAICAAVQAEDHEAALRVLEKAWDPGHCHGEVRFVSDRADDWEPFTDRFVRKPWMKWPWPEAAQVSGKGEKT
jgi:hypothetical protein